MKKLVSLVLALCLLCGAAALAAESTMELTLVLEDGYSVTIPNTVDFEIQEDGSYHGMDTIVVDGKLPAGIKLLFSVTSAHINEDGAFCVANEADESLMIPYYASAFPAYLGEEDLAIEVWTVDTFMTVTSEHIAAAGGRFNCDLHFDLGDTSGKPAGTYKDSLTFTVEEVAA